MTTPAFVPEAAAAALTARMVAELFRRVPRARELAEELASVGARLGDVTDLLGVTASEELRRELEATGFVRVTGERAHAVELWEHPRALLPLIELGGALRAVVRTDSVVDFLEATGRRPEGGIEGPPLGLARRARLAGSVEGELWIAERRGDRAWLAARDLPSGPDPAVVLRHREAFRLRPRPIDAPERGFEVALDLARAARAELGEALACEVFFEAERSFYERRNRAARVQRARQDALGLGWFNRDHHTYRSSRRWFRSLVAVLEALGLRCRERFYAGRDAGWGAQVLEHAETGLCVFADVDLSPQEITGDFAHAGLEPRASVGTVGLWCELHGEAFLAAGMHHLECQFELDAITRQLRDHGIGVMPRFSDFPHLKQAFTEGETWPVAAGRIERAQRTGLLNPSQAERIARDGALGSHFEVLERNDGYRGFNQDGINRIILATDPRRTTDAAAAHG